MNDQKIPSRQQYKETCIKLAEEDHLTTLIAVQMGCEMGMTRLECCNARFSNLDRFHDRGLWVEIAKRIRCSNSDGQKMRSREIPIPPNLYMNLKSYILEGQKYILRRKIGDWKKPFSPRYINNLYERHGVFWSSHASRHFFKNCIWDYMRKNKAVDTALVKKLMGHTLNVFESYGSISWDYKREVIDNTFDNMFFYGKQDEYDEISKQLDIPTEKIKFLYELFIHNGNKFPHSF